MLPFTDYYSLEKYLQEIEYHLLTLPFFPPSHSLLYFWNWPKPCQLPQQQYSATVIDDAIRFVSVNLLYLLIVNQYAYYQHAHDFG